MVAPSTTAKTDGTNVIPAPFTIGDVNPDGTFIHVLDDVTLDIVMGELDTISDFVAYLKKKAEFVRSGKLNAAAGEEELLSYYMTHMNSEHEHDFTPPDGSDINDLNGMVFDIGFYSEMRTNPQYIAKRLADQPSYVWDRLIEQFAGHVLEGTIIAPSEPSGRIEEIERAIRQMALVPRLLRRSYGKGVLETLENGKKTTRATKVMIPRSEDASDSTGYIFMTLKTPESVETIGYEQYRNVRRLMIETYALATMQRHPHVQRIVGIATEPPEERPTLTSQDLILAEAPSWTPELLRTLTERMTLYEVFQEGVFTEYAGSTEEFPDTTALEPVEPLEGNRKERRAAAAIAKRRRSRRR